MVNQANIKAVITAEDKASATLKKFGDNTSKMGSALSSGLKLAGIGLVAAGVAAVAFGVSSVKAFSDAEDRIAQTNAVLKSTNGIAGVTAKSIDDISKSLQRVTKYSDEDVRSVENLLLTFTSIGKDIFPQATKTVLNMATALGEDTKSASIQLGKALQDPILGVTALRRVGVNFSEKQKDVIKKLVETGQSAKAQKLILKELETEFGNSAEAAGNTLSGQLAKLKNSFNDLQEIVGGKVGDALRDVLGKFNIWVEKVGGSQGIMDSLTKSWALLTTGSGQGGIFGLKADSPFIVALLTIHSTFVKIRDAIGLLKLMFQQFLAENQPIIQFFKDQLLGSLSELWNTIQNKLMPTLRSISPEMKTALGWALKLFAGAVIGAIAFMAIEIWVVVNAINYLIKALVFVKQVHDSFMHTAGLVWKGFATAAGAAIRFVGGLLDWIGGKLKWVNDAISSMGGAVLRALGSSSKAPTHKASGGQVNAGQPYTVGEHGQELFVPNQGGRIIPTEQLKGSSQVNITIQAGAFMGSQIEARKYASMIMDAMKQVASAKGTTAQEMLT